jgi:heat shock protein HslJ
MRRILVISLILAVMALVLSACGSVNSQSLPRIVIPGLDRQSRSLGKFSGLSTNIDGTWSIDLLGNQSPLAPGNIMPLVKLELVEDRLGIHLNDGRITADIGNVRFGFNFVDILLTLKFAGGKAEVPSESIERVIYVAPNKLDCVGVAPQKCMLVRENPEDDWMLYYDEIEDFQYEEGYLYKLRVNEETVANAPADGSSIRLKLVEEVSKTPITSSLTGTNWMLETVNSKPPIDKSEITAIFGADGGLYGSAGCNSYRTKYQVGGEEITINPVATTRMACSEPAGVMEQESAYLSLLESAKSFKIVGYRLELYDEGDQLVLTFLSEDL